MATNFPGGVDNFVNPTASDTLDSPDHASQHSDANDAIEAIETALLDGAPLHIDDVNERVGIGTTTPESTLEVNGILTANHIHGNIAGAVYLHVKNTSGVTIPKGSPVYATGSVGASGATQVAVSDADNAVTMPALGIVDAELVNNAEGHAIVLGVAKGLDTSTWSVNDSLYVSVSGGLTNVRPTGASELVQKIGRVIRADASTGEILVLGAGRANDVPNNVVAGGLTIDTDTLHVDSVNNSVGIGTTTPSELLHIQDGSSGVTTHNTQAKLIVESSSDATIEIATPNTGNAYLRFIDPDNNSRAGISYEHSSDVMKLRTAGSDKITIDSSGNVGIGTTAPSEALVVVGDIALTGEIDGPSDFVVSNGQGEGIEFSQTNNATYLKTLGIDRVTVNSSGNVGINTTAPSYTLEVNGQTVLGGRSGINGAPDSVASLTVENGSTAGGSNTNILTYASSARRGLTIGATSTSGRVHIEFKNYNGSVGSISTSGSTTYFNTSSDYRLKENLVPVADAADRLASIPVYEFNFIADPDKTVSGFVAHELAEHIPEAVFGAKDGVDEDGNPVMQGVDQSKVVPLLTAALQEALSMISDLTARMEALEAT